MATEAGAEATEPGSCMVQKMASPALAVKAGRSRGAPVLERLRQEEAERAAGAAEAAAAEKRKEKQIRPFVLTDAALPNGVGVMGRGRAAVNAPLTNDGQTVQALQDRRLSLLSKAEFRPLSAVVPVALPAVAPGWRR